MHVVMSSIGTYGDVLPHIAVGQVLMSRGHDVSFLTSDYFRPVVEAAGLNFDSVLDARAYLAGTRDPAVWKKWGGLKAGWRHLRPVMHEGFSVLARHIRPGTVLTGSSMAFWVRMAQEKFALKAATIHLAPMFLLSAETPPDGVLPGFARLPLAARRVVLDLADKFVSDPIMAADVNRQRAALGLAPVKSVGRRWLHSPDSIICAWPDWFCAPAADWPASAVCAGFARPPSAPPLDPALLDFLQSGAPPVVVTPGSGMGSGQAFFERALAACAAVGQRAVVVTGFRDQLPAILPPFAFHAAFASFEHLAPRAAAFVHAGGIGTTGLLCEAGTPQLFTPFVVDQMDTSARAVAAGAGRRIRPDAKLSDWVAALRHVLHDPAITASCAAVATRARAAPPGREVIASLIERLAIA